jgi:hypothetical protein
VLSGGRGSGGGAAGGSWTRWVRTPRWHPCMPLVETGRTGACERAAQLGSENVTLLASMSLRGMGPCLAVEGSTTREVFEAYLERVLTPSSLGPGRVVVMDNLSHRTQRGPRIRELIEERGCELIYLPPYSPDLNPIEEERLPSSQGAATESWGTYLRGTQRGDRSSSRRSESERCSRLLRAPRLPRKGPSAMTDALVSHLVYAR